ncbi:hypothetical protein F2Q70_00023150 [Brassica cretica]|uniref:Uncharacterized protein n=1 Tax=Brassica cretica TaxID=69181 RepID=A0A8S9GSG6_BRACR|nr:hypothetical protein F2Q70_00023150 [Brassica cretica]
MVKKGGASMGSDLVLARWKDFDVHVVVELYFSELKASHCRKVVVTRLLMFLET